MRRVSSRLTGSRNFSTGVPSLMILLFVFFALPQIGLRTGPLTAAVIGLGLWGGANIGEVFRGALNSIPHRQEQGALALGLSAKRAASDLLNDSHPMIRINNPVTNVEIAVSVAAHTGNSPLPRDNTPNTT